MRSIRTSTHEKMSKTRGYGPDALVPQEVRRPTRPHSSVHGSMRRRSPVPTPPPLLEGGESTVPRVRARRGCRVRTHGAVRCWRPALRVTGLRPSLRPPSEGECRCTRLCAGLHVTSSPSDVTLFLSPGARHGARQDFATAMHWQAGLRTTRTHLLARGLRKTRHRARHARPLHRTSRL